MTNFSLIAIIIMTFNTSMASNDSILKFTTVNNDTIIICKSDIVKIDTANSIIELIEDAATKIKNIESDIFEVFCLNEYNKWAKIDIINVRSSQRKPPFKYIFQNKGSLFFYSDKTLVYEGLFPR